MTTFTAYFRTDAEFASREFEATTPKQALRMARKFLDTNVDEVAVWYDDEMSARLAASDLLDALEGQAAAARSVIENWATGDLAAAVRTLDATISTARAAIAKAKGDSQ